MILPLNIYLEHILLYCMLRNWRFKKKFESVTILPTVRRILLKCCLLHHHMTMDLL